MLYDSLEDGHAQTSLGKVHYKLHVGRPTVAFLHGFGASMLSYKRLVEQLPDSLGVCLVDLLGHGGSEAPRIRYSVEVQAKVVKELMQQLGTESGYIFGHSYGGWIAASIAMDSFRGSGIILEDPAGLKEQIEDDVARYGEAYKDSLAKEAMRLGTSKYVADSSLESETPDTYLTRERLAGVVKPCLIIWGGGDDVVPIKYASLFNEYIKGSALETVQGAGHVAHYTHAGRVKDLILKFVGYST
ncbi:MAG: alpha/beta hydrolase [Candidatus Micrarchaeota archaeon]|nr:alpha/beta hydrolase [Candidatus Micrarchaeota archaeon]